MPSLHVLPSAEAASQAAARFVAELAWKRAEVASRFTVALSGGSTPRLLYAALASPPCAGGIDWARWHVFWSDERCVPPDDAESNYLTAWESLLRRVPVPAEQVHRMRGEASPRVAAWEYERAVRGAFRPGPPAFNLVLLGLGDDGHTASLFPGTKALREGRRLVVANWAPAIGAWRLTFTLPLLNASREMAFLVTGAAKAAAVRRVLEPTPGETVVPAGLVKPRAGEVHWFLDVEAASLLVSRP